MKRDSIYYQIFKRFPALIFELVDYQIEQAPNYRFESVEVKETAFRIAQQLNVEVEAVRLAAQQNTDE